MFFTKTLLAGALAALAAAQSSVIQFTSFPDVVTDGQPTTITWTTTDDSTPVTILLRQGPSTDLQTVQTLTTTGTGGQFVWTPATSLPNGDDYALQIVQGDEINYTSQFSVQGGPATAPSGYTSASAVVPTSVVTSIPAGYSSVTGSASILPITSSVPVVPAPTYGYNSTMAGMASSSGVAMPSASGGYGYPPQQVGNGAASALGGQSTVALVLGALAAVMYVH